MSRLLILGAVGVAVVATGVALVVDDRESQPSRHAFAPLSPVVLHQQAPKAAAPFSVLTRPRVLPAEDHLAAITARMVGSVGGMTELRSIHRPGSRVVIGVGTETTCLSVSHANGSGSSGCAPTGSATNAATPIMAVDYLGHGRYGVSGLMVDGTTGVTVVTAQSTREARLANNVFSISLQGQPTAITWVDPSGQRHRQRIIAESKPASGIPH
jgi:hypothetical protein